MCVIVETGGRRSLTLVKQGRDELRLVRLVRLCTSFHDTR